MPKDMKFLLPTGVIGWPVHFCQVVVQGIGMPLFIAGQDI